MKRFLSLFCLLILNISLSHADVTINIVESSGNVVATASGTISFDQQFAGTSSSPGGFVSGNGFDEFQNSKLHIGTAIDTVLFSADSNNAIFNNMATLTAADSNTGDHIGLISSKPGFSDRFSVDRAYLSGPKQVNATSTWNSTTLATLGFIEGTYIFSANAESTITLNIGNVDSTNPSLQSSIPADNATGVSVAAPTLSLVFDEPVFPQSGVLRMYKTSNDTQVNNRSVTGSTGSGTPNISISFENALEADTEYYVLIPATAFEDAAGNSYAGISSTTELSFTTAGAPTYSVEGTVSGLTALGLLLQNNAGDDLDVFTNGNFLFDTRLDDGSAYAVTVLTNPPGQTCNVTNGSGTIASADVTDVTVICTDDEITTYTVGGAVTGLTGTGLELQNMGADTLPISENGDFTFAIALEVGFSYVVTVSTQPTDQTCTVSNESGTISTANITDVVVNCTDNPEPLYTINGTVSGLGPNSVTLQNNGADDLDVNANGAFVFDTALPDGSSYDVTVLTQPTGQTCGVTNGFGTINGSDVLGVTVTCADSVYTVGGIVTGLTGTGLALQNNGSDSLTIAASGDFMFATGLLSGEDYLVTVSAQPAGQNCVVSFGSGTIATADATDVAVDCADVVVPPPTPMVPIPTLSEWALILLTMLIGLMVFANRRRLF